jgi:hypothetical protein
VPAARCISSIGYFPNTLCLLRIDAVPIKQVAGCAVGRLQKRQPNRHLLDSLGDVARGERTWPREHWFFDVDDRLAELSAKGDDLERVKALVDFERWKRLCRAAIVRKAGGLLLITCSWS